MIWIVGLVVAVIVLVLTSLAEKNTANKNSGFPASRQKKKRK